MKDTLLRTRQLGKTYRHRAETVEALTAVDLEVASGEHVALVGRSGSGKTTLLNLLGGLDRPTAGEVWFDGADIGKLGEAGLVRLRLRRVGFVFQDSCLVEGLTALDNVRLPLYLAGELADGSGRALELMAELELEERADHLPSELSRGESQRVALARALALDPAVLLVDEPTGNLDATSATAVRAILRRCAKEQGKTVLVATHDEELAGDADRRLELSYGRLLDE